KYGKPRHLKKDCKAGNVGNRANRSSTNGSEDGSSNLLKGQSMFNKSHQIYYVTYVYEAFFVQDDDVAWWVDSKATVHVCKDRCWFKTYESLNDGCILHMGNKSTALVHGRGCVDLRFSSGKVVCLLNVLHVPNIRKNLVSSSVLNNYGYKQLNIVFDNIGSAFMLTSKLNDLILWHARLGHVHFKRMQEMSKDRLIPAFDMDTEKCQTCMLNKITKKPFQNVKCKTEVLELIHNDLCDLHATPSLGNKKYFVTFIDDSSRFCYVYLLHSKDEALDKFKVLKTEVELQQGSLIKRFRTNKEGVESRVLGAVVRLPDPKLKTLGKRGIKCIFVGYAKHSKAFRIDSHQSLDQVRGPWTSKDFGPEFQLYLIEGTRDEDVAFGKDELMMRRDSIWAYKHLDVLDDLPSTIRLPIAMASIHNLVIHQMDVKTTFLNGDLDEKVDLTVEFLSSRFSMNDIGEADVILALAVISAALKYLKKTMDYSLTYTGYPSVLEGYTDASWINNTEDNSSTSGYVFVLVGAVEEAEWFEKLLSCDFLVVKPYSTYFYPCDCAATLAKADSQMYHWGSLALRFQA
ncbi:zinc finger, CCHC-type containing protein, partial [Tanacetum coccineum]